MRKSSPILVQVTMLLCAIFAFAGFVAGGVPATTWFIPEGATLSASQISGLFDSSQLYFNVQSAVFPDGEIRGNITPSPDTFQTDGGDPFAANPNNNPVVFAALLEGGQVRPRNVVTTASGYGSVTVDPVTRQLKGFVVTSGIAGTAAQIRDGLPGLNGAAVVTLEGGPVVWTVPAGTVLSEAQYARLSSGACYFNVPSGSFPDGELRGQLNKQVRSSSLSGTNVVPQVTTNASGIGLLALNPVTRQFSGYVRASGFDSAVTSVSVRYGDPATNGPVIVNLVNSGNGVWSIPAFNNPVVFTTVIAAFNSDMLYFSVHTQNNPLGELRGQIAKPVVRIGTAGLDGFNEIPPVSTQASGTGIMAWNSVTGRVSGSVVTDTVLGTAANIHSGSVATNGPALIPLTTNSPVTVPPAPGISFGLDIQPVLSASCARFCHVTGGNTPMSLQTGVSYPNVAYLLVPGDSASSYFYHRIAINDPPTFPQMPLNRPPLSLETQALFRDWIDRGALFDFYPADLTLAVNPASPQLPGTPVAITATGQGGAGEYEFRFWLKDTTGVYTLVQPYSAASVWNWNTGGLPAGTYSIAVQVRASGTAPAKGFDSEKVVNFVIAPATTVQTMDVTVSPGTTVMAGTPLSFSAVNVSGGSGTYEYRFWLKDTSGTYSLSQAYSAANTRTLDTAGFVPGVYSMAVQVKSAGSANSFDLEKVVNFVIAPTAVQTMDVAVSPGTTVLAGTPLSFSAVNVSGGSGIYEYQFWLKDTSGTYSLSQPYSAAGTRNLDTAGFAPGVYSMAVQVKSAGSVSPTGFDLEKVVNFVIAPPAVTSFDILSSPSSLPAAGGTVTVTATNTAGGSGDYIYQFWLKDTSGLYTLAQPYSPSASWDWDTAGLPNGTYYIAVQAKSVGSVTVNGYDLERVAGFLIGP